jgi:hypothetical protein
MIAMTLTAALVLGSYPPVLMGKGNGKGKDLAFVDGFSWTISTCRVISSLFLSSATLSSE